MDLKHLTKLKSQFKDLFKEENQNCELDWSKLHNFGNQKWICNMLLNLKD
jgi:hypothetical protein